MANTEKERLVALETASAFYKDDLSVIMRKLDSIEKKIESLNNFKFQIIGISSVFAVIISFITSFTQSGIFHK